MTDGRQKAEQKSHSLLLIAYRTRLDKSILDYENSVILDRIFAVEYQLGEHDTVRSMSSQKLADGAIHKLPADFRKAIELDSIAKSLWADISPLARNEWICWVTSAKQDATRKRRIEVGIDKMREGMRRPCCWPGCPHR
jgi:Bacteriocin-protection, YdeI or OmpD-Associated